MAIRFVYAGIRQFNILETPRLICFHLQYQAGKLWLEEIICNVLQSEPALQRIPYGHIISSIGTGVLKADHIC